MRSSQVLPGVKRDQDCLPAIPEPLKAADERSALVFGAESFAENPPADIWLPRRGMLLRLLERVLLWLERPVNRLVGTPQLNPFYYTGQIAVFLLLFVSITGLFLVLFFQVGFDASYQFVSRMEEQFLARTLRAAHRYASDSLIIVSLIHAFRLLVMDRFRGPRWLAWVSGVGMLLPIWLAGVTGYWMVWDERALAITLAFDHILRRGDSSVRNLIAIAQKGNSWIFIMIILIAHLMLTALIGGAVWIHLTRLNRPKWLLPHYWLIGLTAVVLLVSAIVPVGMLPKADLTRPPGAFPLDLIYLFYLPLAFNTALNSPGLWLGLLALLVLVGLLPWLSPRPRPARVAIDQARCTGCTVCATDCPYHAITLEPRTDGKPHKFVAMPHPALCVSCGICLGSCDGYAITLGDVSTPAIWHAIVTRLQHAREQARPARVILTCERHAAHAGPGVAQDETVIVLPCVGAAHPDLVGWIHQADVADVRIVGCPPEDCANREGNTWLEQRLMRQRLPRLKREFGDVPIAMHWLPPGEFARAILRAEIPTPTQRFTWRHFSPAFGLLIVVLLAQIWLTHVMFQP